MEQVGRFEVADGSTIFLDEIGELSPELQAKLLRERLEDIPEWKNSAFPASVKLSWRFSHR